MKSAIKTLLLAAALVAIMHGCIVAVWVIQ